LVVSITSIHISDFKTASTDIVEGKNILGVEAGLLGRINLGPVFVKPMLLVSYQDRAVDYRNNDGTLTKAIRFQYAKNANSLIDWIKPIGFSEG